MPRRRRRERGWDGVLEQQKKRFDQKLAALSTPQAIVAQQLREAIMRWTREGLPDPEIAERLGQSVSSIRTYRRASLKRAVMRAASKPPGRF